MKKKATPIMQDQALITSCSSDGSYIKVAELACQRYTF